MRNRRESRTDKTLRRVAEKLRQYGILLASDAHFPNVVAMIAGRPVRGSWWAHRRGREIYRVLTRLESRSEVVESKLVSAKITFVHRKLWPALVAVGSAREGWQVRDLSTSARRLLALVDRSGRIRTDRVAGFKQIGDAARELEFRLLVHSDEVHTELGKHAKELQSWKIWKKSHQVTGGKLTPETAKKEFEKIVLKLNSRFRARGLLPWQN